jgi:hypothetical protein
MLTLAAVIFTGYPIIDAFVTGLIIGFILWALLKMIEVIPMAPPFPAVLKGLVILIAVLLLIDLLLELLGYPLIHR